MHCIRIILLIGISFQALAQSQDCEKWIRIDDDSVNQTYSRSSRENIVVSNDGKDSLTLLVIHIDQSLILSITARGAGDCMDERSKVFVQFRDGIKLTMPNEGKFNCDRELSVFFGGGFGKKKELGMFLTKEIDKIKVETRKSTIDKSRKNFVEQSFSPEQSQALIKVLTCLTE